MNCGFTWSSRLLKTDPKVWVWVRHAPQPSAHLATQLYFAIRCVPLGVGTGWRYVYATFDPAHVRLLVLQVSRSSPSSSWHSESVPQRRFLQLRARCC